MSGLKHLTRTFQAARLPAPMRRAGARPQPAAAPRREPGPSRLAYRLNRLWLTPLYRRLFRVGVPILVICAFAGAWLADDTRRANLTGAMTAMVDRVQSQDAFMVHRMDIEGASPAVDKALRAMLPVTLPASSFDIDLPALRVAAERLDAIEKMELRIQPGGVLSAVVTERTPAILWRHARGLDLLDAGGHRVASVTSRDVRTDLPMIAGEGAGRHAAEALALIDAIGPILPRLRGLERMGERRWDVVLDRGQRIMLPTDRPLPALKRVLAIDREDGLLSRDVVAVDMRDPARPVLRMGLTAQNTLRRAAGLPELDAEGNEIDPEDGAGGGARTASATRG
ncbi:cell division protein FtsQ/DivIB [Paracoccus sp. (in: a-proteobacteria)]|uniref:cell division protein FtsQ/DivIB n=1 Tax=Paracoccus sp. TaxID=267 RepID=UPI0026DEDEBA|nr:cell division protein FtsQ/DivIB [Paracoccus sp. (in: a-proteobacteria)]MDO5369897.1 cell division protein FtsQ/DivIB [Paracoccus sp. (in: a-proteobacteria)]